MSINQQIAKHFREVHFGGNWTSVNIKDSLADITWQQATTKVDSFNTIATLVYHCNYYVHEVIKVFNGDPLVATDELSFHVPTITSEEDWQSLLNQTWADAEIFASLVEQLTESILWENFTQEKYGNYYRNIHGIIEHAHYHLGQIVILKKLIRKNN